jgi:signal transduction histidine kinase
LASGAIALVVGVSAVWVGFSTLLDTRGRLFDRLQPTLVDVQRLNASLVDQETGIRGYAITRDDRLLDPYRQGQISQLALEDTMRARFEREPNGAELTAALDDVDAAFDEWRREVADPIVAAPVAPEDVDALFLRSKASFDEVRGQTATLEELVTIERDAARQDLDDATAQLVAVVGIAMAFLALVAIGGAWYLRRRVVRSIDELVASADAVVLDRLDQPIEVDGPSEIEHLALQVGAMRDRIARELLAVEEARAEIDRRAEELARSNADLEQFAYVASHDLQEPLRKVASFCQLIEQRYGDQLDDRGRSYIEFAVDGAKRMQALITDLLEFSRVGRTTEGFVPCDLHALALEAVEDLRAIAGDAEFEIGPLPTLPGDPALFGALLQNLVGNAIKYRADDRRLRVRLEASADEREWTFTFTDNGIGIEPRFRERVFVIFQRLHGRDAFEGTGIGLALCKKIVEFSGGRIWIAEPADGIGTRVCWTLPVADPAPPVAHSSSPDSTGAPLDAGPTDLHPTDLHPTDLHPTDLHPTSEDAVR